MLQVIKNHGGAISFDLINPLVVVRFNIFLITKTHGSLGRILNYPLEILFVNVLHFGKLFSVHFLCIPECLHTVLYRCSKKTFGSGRLAFWFLTSDFRRSILITWCNKLLCSVVFFLVHSFYFTDPGRTDSRKTHHPGGKQLLCVNKDPQQTCYQFLRLIALASNVHSCRRVTNI